MVARGIKRKGLGRIYRSFYLTKQTNPKCNAHLILVGKGDFLKHLSKKYIYKNIHFVGASDNPFEWIQKFDVCLLPTYFINESTPNSIIEYIVCKKPIISTNYVEIPNMLKGNNNIAGKLIDLNEGKLDYRDLFKYMELFINNPDIVDQYSKIADEASKKFNLKNMFPKYLSFFKNVTNKKKVK